MNTINDAKSIGNVILDEGGNEMAQNGGRRTEYEEGHLEENKPSKDDDAVQLKQDTERNELVVKQTLDVGANSQNNKDATGDEEHLKVSDINHSPGMEIDEEKEKENDKIKEVGKKDDGNDKSMEESEGMIKKIDETMKGDEDENAYVEMPTVSDDLKTEKSYEDSDKEEGMKKRRRSSGRRAKASLEEDDKDGSTDKRTPVASTDRPVRERKSVDRLVTSMKRDEVKDIVIEQGPGTPLKDIPNVAYKLSKRKVDDTLKMLHIVLFGRRGKLFRIKTNISRFSGFVWHENEENQKAKVKEKLDKWNKDKLYDACYVLDIPVVKAATRKEDIITKLFDFLTAPHPTTTVLLAEKKQPSKAKKRKRMSKSGASSSGRKRTVKPQRKSKNISKVEEKGAVSAEKDETNERNENGDDEDNSLPEKSMDDVNERSESEEKDGESESESEEDKAKKRRKSRSSSTKMTSAERGRKKTSTPREDRTPSKKVSRKKRNEEAAPKSTSEEKSGKNAAKDTTESDKPTDDELRNAICEILKEVDFNTATFTDILKKLCAQFNTDLMPRKASVKLMIQDELTKLADEEGDDEDDDEADGDKDEGQRPSNDIET